MDIASAIVAAIEDLGLSLTNLRGQGYHNDGASNIRGHKSGVQKQIRDKQPKALYTHCASHSLNPVVITSCSVQAVRIALPKLKVKPIGVRYLQNERDF